MKKITLFLFALFTCWQINAQVSNYAFSQSNGTYTPITGGTVLGTTTSDDQRFVDPATLAGGTTTTGVGFPIGFNFTFNEIVFDRVAINNNGWISLGQSSLTPAVNNASTSSYDPLSSTAAITPTLLRSRISAIGDDLQAQTGSELRIETIGTAPNRVFVVQWTNYREYLTTGQNLNFQIRLNETTNIVEVVYGTMVFTTNSETAQIGLGGSANTDFNNRTTTTNWNTTTAGTASNSSATYSTTVTPPVSGLTFVWTPPLPCTGVPVAGTAAPANQTLLAGQASSALTVAGQTTGVAGLTYQWEESTDGTNWVNATGGTGATTLSYTPPVFGGSMIMYRLRITCTASTLSEVSTAAVLNPCGAYSVPTLETLDTFLPTCWQEADNGDLVAGPSVFLTGAWAVDGLGNQGTTGAARILIDGAVDNDWILSPLYTIPATGYELKFLAAATQSGGTAAPTTAWETDDFVEVLVSTGTTNWTVLYTYNDSNVPSNTGLPNIIDLDAFAGQTVRFAFRAVEGASNGAASIDFSIDDFEIRLTPPCVEPTTLSVGTITSDSAELFWVDPTGTQFDYEYVVQAAGAGTPTVNGTQWSDVTVIESGLSANTNYEFWVRADCGGAGFSAWVGPFTFRTPCANFVAPWTYDVESAATTTNSSIADCWTSSPTNTTAAFRWDVDGAGSTPSAGTGPSGAYSGSKYFYTEASSGTAGAVAYLTPISVDVTALTTPYLEFYYHMYGVNMGTLEVEVYDGSVWTSIWSLSGQQQTSDTAPWLSAGIDMSAHAVANVLTFRFKGTRGSSFEGDMSLDNISVIEAPTCLAPSALALVSVGTDTATFQWTANSSETDWEYVIQPQGTGVPGGAGIATNTNPLVVNSGLNPNTPYEIYIRANCGAGGFSTWVGPINFRTSNAVICGTPVNTTYCYTDNDTTSWTFTSNDGSPLRITFNAGGMESCCDDIFIYDGTNSSGTLLYQGNNGGNLAGLTFDSTSDSIFVILDTDGSVSCAAGSTCCTSQLDFTVACATCVNPTATFTTVPNCASGQYSIDVNVTDLGSATSITISDGTNTLPNISSTGIQTFGPYTSGSPVTITLTNDQDGSCSLSSGVINYSCPPVNDDCANAIVLTPGGVFADNDIVGTIVGGTNSAAPAPGCASYSGSDVWYSVTVPASGSITIETNNNSSTLTDTGMAVYSGSCGTLTLVECDDDDSPDGNFSFISLTGRTPGEVLYVLVWEYNGGTEDTFLVSAYDASLSTGSFDNANFVAYPNPVKDILNVSYTSEISSLRVINMIGQEVITKNINATSAQVDMSQLSAGTYIVNVTIGDAVKTLKVVKQ